MHSSLPITIVPFEDRYAPEFERLNRLWLEAGDFLEPLDLVYLGNPRKKIIDVGGEIFFALRDGEVIGTAAAIPMADDVWELAKLTVASHARGARLGERLVHIVIDHARAHGARRIALTSNSTLTTAVALYRRLGFEDRPIPADVGYEKADVYMELDLPSSRRETA